MVNSNNATTDLYYWPIETESTAGDIWDRVTKGEVGWHHLHPQQQVPERDLCIGKIEFVTPVRDIEVNLAVDMRPFAEQMRKALDQLCYDALTGKKEEEEMKQLYKYYVVVEEEVVYEGYASAEQNSEALRRTILHRAIKNVPNLPEDCDIIVNLIGSVHGKKAN